MKLWVAILMCVVGTGAVWAAENKLGVDVEAAWASKYIWRGVDQLDDVAAFQPSVNFDLWGTGFSTKLWTSYAGSDTEGLAADVEYDYSITYANSVMKDDAMQVDYAFTYTYLDYPKIASEVADFQDVYLALAMPNIFPGGFVPRYAVAYSWSGRPGPTPGALTGRSDGAAGFVHFVGLDYNFKLGEQPLTLCADAVYNDGTYGDNVDHDWSHIVWGLCVPYKCPLTGAKVTPGFYYQTSMDDSVNTEDEMWISLSYKFSF